jgi:hypothetical protein
MRIPPLPDFSMDAPPPVTRRLGERDLAVSQVERAAVDEGVRRDIEECIRDTAVTVPGGDEDTWNSKRYAVLRTVAVEAATPSSPSCVGCRYGVGDVYEGISCRVRDSNLHGSLDVLRNEATYDLLWCDGRVVAVIVLSRYDEKVGFGLGNHAVGDRVRRGGS